MKTVADALENLQSNCYYAHVLPTLLKVKKEINDSSVDPKIKICKPLAKALKNGFQDRFDYYFDVEIYQSVSGFIATVTHPFFKLRWHNEM